MTIPDDEIGTWFRIEPQYKWQLEVWRCGGDGLVAALEPKHDPWAGEAYYNAYLLPQNHEDDPEPIKSIFERVEGAERATNRLHEWLAEHPNGE